MKKRYGMKELCMWKNSIPIFYLLRMEKFIISMGKKVMPIGGAYSIDKYYRICHGLPWFETEQPDEMIKEYVEQQLDKAKWNVDIVLSHTVPIKAEPVWAFIPGLDQSAVDKSTEKWLQKIYDRLDFTEWYA